MDSLGRFSLPHRSGVCHLHSSMDDTNPILQMMAAVEIVLQGIGEDVARDGLIKTPLRVASAFHGALAGYQLSAKEIIESALFPELGTSGRIGSGGGSGGMVTVSNVDSFAFCETCLLPFRLRCHVAYIPCGQRVVGLSKFPRVVEVYAKRLQTPQKLADQLAEALNKAFLPSGVGVVVESWHVQWPGDQDSRGFGVEGKLGLGSPPLVVRAGKGEFEDPQGHLWEELLAVLQFEGVDLERADLVEDVADGLHPRQQKEACPFRADDGRRLASLGNFGLGAPETGGSDSPRSTDCTASSISASAAAMAAALESQLSALGAVEPPSKEELGWAALRFVEWIVAATQGSRFRGSPCADQMEARRGNSTGAAGSEIGCSGSMGDAASTFRVQKGADGRVSADSNGTIYRTGALSNGSSSGQSDLTKLGSGGALLAGGCSRITGLQRTGFENEVPLRDWGRSLSRIKSGAGFLDGPLFCSEPEIPFSSVCEHHLLPFFGVIYIGYVPANGTRQIDRTLLAGVVALYSRRLQAQERLTRQILVGVMSLAGLQGAVAVARARHMCVMSRGVAKLGSTTATVATIGKFSTDSVIRAAFLRSLPRNGLEKISPVTQT